MVGVRVGGSQRHRSVRRLRVMQSSPRELGGGARPPVRDQLSLTLCFRRLAASGWESVSYRFPRDRSTSVRSCSRDTHPRRCQSRLTRRQRRGSDQATSHRIGDERVWGGTAAGRIERSELSHDLIPIRDQQHRAPPALGGRTRRASS